MDHAEVRRIRLMLRLLRNVRVDHATGCWLYTGRLNNQRYPTITVRVRGRKHPVPMFAHRVACEIFKGAPKPGLEAAHVVDCPHRHCINPDHVRWATRTENEADKRHPSRLRLREVHPPMNTVAEAA